MVAIAAAMLAGLAATQSDHSSRQPSAPQPERRAARQRQDPAVATAARYALAARNWTPATYRRSWQAQLALAAGSYRRALLAARPDARYLAGLREEGARSQAQIADIERDPTIARPAARVIVTLAEVTLAAGQAIRGPTVNRVDLRLIDGRWRVIGWTVIPGAGGP